MAIKRLCDKKETVKMIWHDLACQNPDLWIKPLDLTPAINNRHAKFAQLNFRANFIKLKRK